MRKKNVRQVWDQLRAQGVARKDVLRQVAISGLRGIDDLRVSFPYPVAVLAGPNGCGKSTVLRALACAYRPPGAGPRDFVPSTLFPDFRSKQADVPDDPRPQVVIEFDYLVGGRPARMRWRRKRTWNRSGMGGGKAPERGMYLRTLANLSNPSEVRSLLQLGRRDLSREQVDAADITLAHRILPWHYQDVMRLRSNTRELLFISRDGGVSYSEFHMSSGERSVMRMSLDLSRLRNALVLVDEIETGLHPFTQQVLMLELQRLALRNELQIVVATHSSVVLESVPVEARIFLERDDRAVTVRPPHHDVVQRAFYGHSLDRLSVVCEDEAAVAIIRGIFDHLFPALGLVQSDVEIGRNTGKDEFKHHVAAFARFRQLWSTLFVLDGDARKLVADLESTAARHGQSVQVVCLPGDAAPELWAWGIIQRHRAEYASVLGVEEYELARLMQGVQQTFDGAAHTEANKAKGMVSGLAQGIGRTTAELLRIVGRLEAARGEGEIAETLAGIRDAISRRRDARGE
jgi:predicted ATPase